MIQICPSLLDKSQIWAQRSKDQYFRSILIFCLDHTATYWAEKKHPDQMNWSEIMNTSLNWVESADHDIDPGLFIDFYSYSTEQKWFHTEKLFK